MTDMKRDDIMYTIEDETGEHLFKEIFRMVSDRTQKTYVVLEPVGEPEYENDEVVEVFAFEIDEMGDGQDDQFNLKMIENDDEFEEVMEAFDTMYAEFEDEE